MPQFVPLARGRLQRPRANLFQTLHTAEVIAMAGVDVRLYVPPFARSFDVVAFLSGMGVHHPIDLRGAPLLAKPVARVAVPDRTPEGAARSVDDLYPRAGLLAATGACRSSAPPRGVRLGTACQRGPRGPLARARASFDIVQSLEAGGGFSRGMLNAGSPGGSSSFKVRSSKVGGYRAPFFGYASSPICAIGAP